MDDPAIPGQPSVVPQPPFPPPSPPLETPVVEVPEEPFLVPPRPATDQPVPPVIPSLDNPPPPPPPPPPSSPKRTPMKSVIIGLIAVFVIAGGVLGYYFFQKGGMDIGRKASEGDRCTYGETCGSGKRCCTGTIQGGSCKYDPSVATNCSNCSLCVPGDCGCGCSGCDSSPTSSPTSSPGERCCPGGTKDCPSGQQCVRGGSCGNICVSQPYPLPGCCNSGSDCASWETCEEGNRACPSNKSCRSHAGCANSSDCAGGAICVEGTCQGGTSGNVICEANQSGVKITNTTGADITGTVEWFSKKCDSKNGTNCSCSGAPATESFTVSKSGGTWSKSISGSGCAWQSDVKVSASNNPIATGCNNANAGCISGCSPTTPPVAPSSTPTVTPRLSVTPGPSPTPTVTPIAAACVSVAVEIAAGRDINNLQAGDTISFTASFRGAVEDVAVDLRKGGVSVKSFYAGGPKTNTWTTPSYTIGSAGSYEVMAFIKSNGEWR